jgi:hypothetical protein
MVAYRSIVALAVKLLGLNALARLRVDGTRRSPADSP